MPNYKLIRVERPSAPSRRERVREPSGCRPTAKREEEKGNAKAENTPPVNKPATADVQVGGLSRRARDTRHVKLELGERRAALKSHVLLFRKRSPGCCLFSPRDRKPPRTFNAEFIRVKGEAHLRHFYPANEYHGGERGQAGRERGRQEKILKGAHELTRDKGARAHAVSSNEIRAVCNSIP